MFFSGRSEEKIKYIEAYLKANKMFRDYNQAEQDPLFSEVSTSGLMILSKITLKLSKHWKNISTRVLHNLGMNISPSNIFWK